MVPWRAPQLRNKSLIQHLNHDVMLLRYQHLYQQAVGLAPALADVWHSAKPIIQMHALLRRR
jgi:hypothetical protein